jgi:TolA-binding protein
MKAVSNRTAAAALALLAAATPSLAQYQPQYQSQYPGAAAVQAPATQASVANLDNRIVGLERQIADLLRAEEENGHRIAQLETQLKQSRDDAAARIAALEAQLSAAAQAPAASVPTPVETAPPRSKPALAGTPSTPKPIAAVAGGGTDAAEEAYDTGYQLWKAGQYDEAIGALRAFTAAYPKHRRTSWANNLTGRALLDKGEPRAAAEVLLANYRSNPKGERAADSLYYLGQALVKLKQPSQACKAYAELEAVYGSSIRPDLRKMLASAKTDAKCA